MSHAHSLRGSRPCAQHDARDAADRWPAWTDVPVERLDLNLFREDGTAKCHERLSRQYATSQTTGGAR